jgi:hypothetical protein
MNNHQENLARAAEHYGLESQLRKTLEELEELYIAIHTRTFVGDGGVYEEMADVYNMLDQLCILTDKGDTVRQIAEQKMIRTIKRMEDEKC